MSIARLTERMGVTRQAVTKHLHVLAGAGVVRATSRGRAQLWRVEPGRLDEARQWLQHIEGQWDEALARLKTMLERPVEEGT
jgi:DNA-binding transcriptional ArsR family regulator